MPPLNKKSGIILHGAFTNSVYDRLKARKSVNVFIMEGRPDLWAAKCSSSALLKRRITPTLIADNMAGFLFYKNFVKEVWVAYQNHDDTGALCNIGALILGVLAERHGIPVHLYPGEMRRQFLAADQDLLQFNGKPIAPDGTKTYVPLVEWLPKKYVERIWD